MFRILIGEKIFANISKKNVPFYMNQNMYYFSVDDKEKLTFSLSIIQNIFQEEGL